MVPVILVLAVVGALQFRGLFADVICAAAFGVLGYLMKRQDWPRIPLVIALALAPMFETNLHLTLRLQELGRIDFWSRPGVLVLAALTVTSLLLPAFLGRLRVIRGRRGTGP
jgi:putative tricarboxylic transport membrane protein